MYYSCSDKIHFTYLLKRGFYLLVIKFVVRGSQVIWFIDNNWVAFLAFLLTMSMGVIFRRVKSWNQRVRMPNLTGGDSIADCIEFDGIYEVIDPGLEIIIKQMLNIGSKTGPVIISVPVLIISYLVAQQPIKQMTILGVDVFVNQIKNLVIKTVVGIACGSIFFFTPAGLVGLSSALISGAIIFNIARGINHIECNNFVSKVPTERLSSGRKISFLERPAENNSRVFIKDKESIVLYSPYTTENKSCYLEDKLIEVSDSNLDKTKTKINRKYEKKCGPLKERTKTMADLVKHDPTTTRNNAESKIKIFEENRKRIPNQKINTNEE